MPPKAVRRPGDYCGLRNAGATCYMNAVFQQLYMQPRIRALILGAPEVPEADRAESVFAQLQAVFASMALGLVTHTTPDGFWHAFKDYDGQPIDIREHQDAYEFFTRLQDCVDSHLQSVGCTPALQTVMGGRFAQQVICKGLPYRSEREEEFLQISVDVRGMGSLEKSLENYVQGELMEGDNAYLCEELGRRVPAVKRACIKALPHTLVIHLKRFEFDYHSQTRFKVRDRFEFPEELDLFPFTAAGLAAAEAESAAANGEGGGGGNSSSGHGPSLPRKSSSGASEVAGTAAAAASGGSAARATAARSEYMYDLAGVVVHSGSAFTGHYYSFARERSALAGGAATARRARGWYCFDDKSVRPWDVSNLETDCFGGRASQDYANRGWRPPRNEVDRPHSAYMLFYERCCEWELNAQALQEAEVVQRQQRGKEQEEQQQQQQQHAPGASTSGCSGGGAFVAPWGMPLSLYRQVMLTNITIMMQLHTLDKEFFKFVRQLVENRGDVGGQLSSRKARRRELPPAVAAPVLAAAGAVSGGSCSAMSCDPAPSGTPGTAAGDSGAPISYEQLPSPGPSSRRGEEAEQISVLLTCLALRFQLQLYQRAATALRSDSAIWAEALKALLNAPGPAVGACQLAALQLLQSEPGWMRTLLVLTSDMGARDFVADVVSFLLVHAAQRCNLHAYLSGTSPALAGGSGTEQHQQPQQLQTASALLAPALLKVVEQLVQLLVSTVHAAASDADDQYCVAAVAAVLRDYAVGAPPLHSALLVQRQDLVLCLVEHLSMLYMGGADTMDDFRDDGPAVARLLYTLVSRAGNLERLTLELNASAQVGAGSGRCVASGMQNPYAVTGRLGEPGLFAHAYKRLIDEDAINALMDPVVLCVPEALSLLQILTWENVHATQYVASHLIGEAMGMSGAQMLHMLPMIVVPVRDVLSVRDSIALLRAWAALFLRSGGPQPCLIAGLQEGSSQGWGAIRKMLLIACVDAVLQQLTPKELQQLMQAGFSNQASIATMLLHELSTLDSELTSLEAIDHQGSAALIKTHLPAVKFFKNVLMSHLQQLPHIQQFLQQQQQQQQEDEDEEQQQQQKQARVRSSSDSKDPGGAPVLSESAAPL